MSIKWTDKKYCKLETKGEPIQILIALKCQLVIATDQDGNPIKISPSSVAEHNGGWIMASDKGLYMTPELAEKFEKMNKESK